MIRNLRESDVEGCFDAECDFKLFNTKVDVFIDMEELDIDYVNKCVENLNSLIDELIDKLCEYTIRYCEDCRCFFEDEEIDIPENIKGRDILNYVSPVTIGIEEPDDKNSIGYVLEFNVLWEEEHGMEWVIRDNQILYVSQFDGTGAFDEEYDESYVQRVNFIS